VTDTGPPYPPGPAAGSNAIGSFTLGVSPLGDIAPFNFWQTVISQYANSPIITQILESLDAALDQTENFDNLYDDIWNVQTAQGYGLDVWGRIVGVTRVVKLPAAPWFGFQEALPGPVSFNESGVTGAFYNGSPEFNNYVLADSDFLTLILAKAAANISNGSIPAINNILMTLFPNLGNCYVTDGQNMTMTYTFTDTPSQVQLSIAAGSGILPKPVGVQATFTVPA
jgi:Protein of unknown function (DUF2612)